MKQLTIYEPAMCCNTGVCGPSVDEQLLQVTAAMEALKSVADVAAVRYNLSNAPQEFVTNTKISALLKEKGTAVLPITMLDGEFKKVGAYPSLDEITAYTGIRFVAVGQTDSCCGGSGSSCC